LNSLLLSDGVLGSSGFTLGLEFGLTDLLSLQLVDGLNEDVLVLELVTLGREVELVVNVSVDLLGVSILLQEASNDSLSAHPQDLDGHTGVAGTLSVTGALMTALSLGLSPSLRTGARVHGDLASHEETVLVKFANILACKRNELINKNENKARGANAKRGRSTYGSWQEQPRWFHWGQSTRAFVHTSAPKLPASSAISKMP